MRRECAGGLGTGEKGLKRNGRRGSRRADRGTYEAGQSCQLARFLLREVLFGALLRVESCCA